MDKVSVIISVYNGEKTIAKCLDSVLALDYPDFEVIVMDDCSTDGTMGILQGYGKKISKWKPKFNCGQALCRNMGVDIATGSYIAFIDADVIVDRYLLKTLMSSLTNNAGIGGIQRCPIDATPKQKVIYSFLHGIGFMTEYQGQWRSRVAHLPSCNVLYRKDIFQKFNGFRNMRYGEDGDLNYRITKAGYGLIYEPNAICYHYPPETFKAFFKKMFHYGQAQAEQVIKFGIFRIIQIVPFITLAIIAIIFWHIGFYKRFFTR